LSYFVVNILESFLGEAYSHNDSTGQLKFDCPNCSEINGLGDEGDGKHNLEVNYLKNKFNCWSCGKEYHMHGPISKLIKKFGTKQNLKEYELYGPTEDEINEYLIKDKIINAVKLPEEFKSLTEYHKNDSKYFSAKNYLKNRGITENIIKKYNIGYASEGYYKNRIIIPSYDSNYNLNYFISRSFFEKSNIKYLNPKSDKQILIFNEHLINYDTTIFLVEGVFDHIVIPNSIPLLGKVLYDFLKQTLIDKANADIVILLDGDAKSNIDVIYEQLNVDRLRGKIKKCIIEDNNIDPSKMYEIGGSKGLVNLLRNGIKL